VTETTAHQISCGPVTRQPPGRFTDMRGRSRRLPLIAVGALAALIALILAGTYIYSEREYTGVLVDQRGSGPGGETTEVFTVHGAWDLRWSYDCSSSLRNKY